MKIKMIMMYMILNFMYKHVTDYYCILYIGSTLEVNVIAFAQIP